MKTRPGQIPRQVYGFPGSSPGMVFDFGAAVPCLLVPWLLGYQELLYVKSWFFEPPTFSVNKDSRQILRETGMRKTAFFLGDCGVVSTVAHQR